MFSFPFGSFNNNFFPLANKLCGTWNVILRQLTKVFQAIYCVLLSFPLEGRFLSPSTLFVGMLIFYIFVAFISGTLKKNINLCRHPTFLENVSWNASDQNVQSLSVIILRLEIICSRELSYSLWWEPSLWEGNIGLNLTSQYQLYITDDCHVIINLLYNFVTTLSNY